MKKKVYFPQRVLPYVLVAPQVLITLIFFIWPAFTAIKQSFFSSDVFGLRTYFSGFENFRIILNSADYINAAWVTLIFSASVTILTLSSGLLMAVLVNRVIRASDFYKTLLIWPYAVAPAVAGILWRFLFNPSIGIISYFLHKLGYDWNYLLHPHQALALVVIAASWQQFSYNFLFFLAGLKAIPQSLLDAASMDGAGVYRRFWTVVFPLLSPTTFFLLVINLIYAFFDTFGIIHVVTHGGPANATNILVYKVYNDGFIGLNSGSSSAQSVILMSIVIVLTVIQFRYLERKVHY